MSIRLGRDAYGQALYELGLENKDIVVLDADLQACTRTDKFAEAFPDRYFNVGIAEANMAGIAAGLATCGKTVFINSFAMFASGRIFEQVRNSICYPGLNVKIFGSHAGITVGKDGATHECIEDLACMRAIPGMKVFNPADYNEAYLVTKAMADFHGPCYMRLSRLEFDDCTNENPNYKFSLGKAAELKEGKDITLIATGLMVPQALKAADILKAEGISAAVLDIHAVKPLDEQAVLDAARKTGCIVTAEEANIHGGLGDAVCAVTSAYCPVPVLKVGVMDKFGKSGDPLDLLKLYGLTPEDIAARAKDALAMKR